MKPQFDNILAGSFQLWLDNKICNDGSGFINVSSPLYQQRDPARSMLTYASPFKGWVYDSCVQNATIPSGVYNSNGNFLTRQSGIIFDFNEGRILSSGNLGPIVSGSYARKEYNVYFSTEEAAYFYLEAVQDENQNIIYGKTGIGPYVFAAPCIIFTNSYSNDRQFALGGEKDSRRTFRLFSINDDNYNAEALNTLIVDSKETYFSMVPLVDMPLTFYGDYKTGSWSYCDIQDKYPCKDGAFIENVYSFKLSEKTNQNKTFSINIYEFDISRVRFRGTI